MNRFTFFLLLSVIFSNAFPALTPDSIPVINTSDSIPATETTDSIPVVNTSDSIPATETTDSIPVTETTDTISVSRIAVPLPVSGDVGDIPAGASGMPDSCYVFAELRWDPGLFSYSAKIIYTDFMEDIRDKNGKKLKFNGFIRAVNYMSIQGWEVMQIYPYHYGDKENEQIAILRKRVPLAEALRVSQPKAK